MSLLIAGSQKVNQLFLRSVQIACVRWTENKLIYDVGHPVKSLDHRQHFDRVYSLRNIKVCFELGEQRWQGKVPVVPFYSLKM